MFSLLVGQQISLLTRWTREGRALLPNKGALCITALLLIGGVVANSYISREAALVGTGAIRIVAAIAIVGICTIAWLMAKRQTIAAAYSAIATFLACSVGISGWILPEMAQPLDTRWINQEIRDAVTGSPEIVGYRASYHPFYYVSDFPLVRVESDVDLHQRLQSNQQLLVFTSLQNVEHLKKACECRLLKELPYVGQSRDHMCLLELQSSHGKRSFH
jgi:hypothetical protein